MSIVRSKIVAACCACALLAVSSPVRAEADGPDFFRVDAPEALEIRSEPDAKAKPLGKVGKDADGLRNLGCKGGLTLEQFMNATEAQKEAGRLSRWCRVEYRGVTGWLPGRYLFEGGAPE